MFLFLYLEDKYPILFKLLRDQNLLFRHKDPLFVNCHILKNFTGKETLQFLSFSETHWTFFNNISCFCFCPCIMSYV